MTISAPGLKRAIPSAQNLPCFCLNQKKLLKQDFWFTWDKNKGQPFVKNIIICAYAHSPEDKTKSSLKNDTNFCALFMAKQKKKKKGKTLLNASSQKNQLEGLIQFYANKQPGEGAALNSELKKYG